MAISTLVFLRRKKISAAGTRKEVRQYAEAVDLCGEPLGFEPRTLALKGQEKNKQLQQILQVCR
mgnify:CR=1 FL=1